MLKFLTAGCESRACDAFALSMWIAASFYAGVTVYALAYVVAH